MPFIQRLRPGYQWPARSWLLGSMLLSNININVTRPLYREDADCLVVSRSQSVSLISSALLTVNRTSNPLFDRLTATR